MNCTAKPTVIQSAGGVLLQYATAPGFAIAVCGYADDEIEIQLTADELSINIVGWQLVDGWSAVDQLLLEMGLLSQEEYDSRWIDIPF